MVPIRWLSGVLVAQHGTRFAANVRRKGIYQKLAQNVLIAAIGDTGRLKAISVLNQMVKIAKLKL